MVIAYIPLVFIVVGALLWAFVPNKVGEFGRMMCFAGLLSFALANAHAALQVAVH